MTKIRGDVNTGRQVAVIRAMARGRLRRAANNAVNWTAFDTRERVQRLMKRVFDTPTRYTLAGVRVDRSNQRRLQARVYLRDQATKGNPPSSYLGVQSRGGARPPKRFEKALRARGAIRPSQFVAAGPDARLNKSGNISGGMHQKILSALGASRDAAQDSRTSGGWFVMREPGPRHRGTLEGRGKPIAIARRRKSGVQIWFWIIDSAPVYRQRFRFKRFARRTADRLFPARFDRALNRVLRRG